MPNKDYEVNGTTYSFPDSYDDEKVKGILTKQGIIKTKQPEAPAAPTGFGERMVQTGVGMAKGVGSTALGLGELAYKGLAASRAKTPDLSGIEKMRGKLQPANPSQKAGYNAEQVLEYATPLGEEKLIAGIPKGLQLLSRAGMSAARTGVTAAAQSGDPGAAKAPAAAAGAVTLGVGALGPVLGKALGEQIQRLKVRPSKFDLSDGFKIETLKGLKGNLSQSLDQVEQKLASLKSQRNALVAPGMAKVDIGQVFDQAIAQAKKEAGALKYGPEGEKLVGALETMRDDTYKLIGVPKGASKAVVDVRNAENLKEHLGVMGAWAYGQEDRAAKLVEKAANGLYTGTKEAIETSLGPAGGKVKSLNKEMQALIPVKHAMLKAIPVEQRKKIFDLTDLAGILPAALTGDVRLLGIEALKKMSESMRFGNWLVRNAPKASGGVEGRAAGALVASPKNKLQSPE